MSSSSSDSDSDDFEPIRRIKINIKPKDTIPARDGADVEAIKASVEAWRPLGPRPHPSLTRRQSSLSSVSSLSFGTASNDTQSGPSCSRTVATADTAGGGFGLNHHDNQSRYGTSRSNMFTSNHTNNSMRSSPSCSSLVNEFTNRTSFSNFMPNASRTSSPLTFMNCNSSNLSETVPIALAIQESIELTVKGQHRPALNGCDARTQFETRALGNIKVAFPNSFARLCSQDEETNKDPGAKRIPALKLRLHSTENIIRYYASGLVKGLDSELSATNVREDTLGHESNNNDNHCGDSNNTTANELRDFRFDPFDMNESPGKFKHNSKIIEIDMASLIGQLKRQYDQSPNMRYYNVDVLRYQIAPIEKFEKCPLQVCAYWKLESKLIKLRLDFKHSSQSGFNLERLREVSFIASLDNLIPSDLSIKPVLPNQVSTLTRSSTMLVKNHNDSNMYPDNRYTDISSTSAGSDSSYSLLDGCNNQTPANRSQASTLSNKSSETSSTDLLDLGYGREDTSVPLMPQTQQSILVQPQAAPRNVNSVLHLRLPPPPSSGHFRHHRSGLSPNNSKNTAPRSQPAPLFPGTGLSQLSAKSDVFSFVDGFSGGGQDGFQGHQPQSNLNNLLMSKPTMQQVSTETTSTDPISVPYITFEPQATWDDRTKKLTWKFDNLLTFYKSDGSGSLLAKLDFRHCNMVPSEFMDKIAVAGNPLQNDAIMPKPIDIKFMVADSTLSKISLTIDSTGYRMSLLKKEVRSGRYRSEPCTF